MSGKDERKASAKATAAQSIVVGVLMDACDVMLKSGAFHPAGASQAVKVIRWCREVLDTLPRITSARGIKNLDAVCAVITDGFCAQWPTLPPDSGMSACARIFATQSIIGDMRILWGLNTRPWRYLDQTATTMVAKILEDIPEEEAAMWAATVPVHDLIMGIAA